MPLPPKTPPNPGFGHPSPDTAYEQNIPTLDSIAMPNNNEPTFNSATFESVLIGAPPPRHGLLFNRAPPPETQLSNEDIHRITEKLRSVLLPEIDKAVSYAMNHAFAFAMDQAANILRQKVHTKLQELLPALVQDAIRNPARKS